MTHTPFHLSEEDVKASFRELFGTPKRRQATYICAPQQRILRLLILMAGQEIHGVAPSGIARAQQCSAAIVTRDLSNLRKAGMAEQVPETNRWRLAPRIVQIAVQHQVALDRAEQRLSETRQRFSRTL